MRLNVIVLGTGLLYLSWSSVALAQLGNDDFVRAVPPCPPSRECFQTSPLNSDPPQPPFLRGENSVQDSDVKFHVPQIAQINPDIPPGVLEPTRPTLSPLPALPSETPTPSPSLTPPELPLTPSPEIGVTVKVERIEVLGSTVFSADEVQAAVASFVGKEATFEELLAIRTAITDLYTTKGYTTSGAFLPAQDLTDGVVRIQVIEGAIESIDVQGLKRLQTSYIRDRIALATGAPINLRRLEEALQLLQDNPLIRSVQAELSTGSAPGLSTLTLNVTEAQPITASVVVENRDSPSVGELRGTVVIAHNNLLGFGDRFSASYGITEGIDSYNLSYGIPVNPREGTLSLSYSNDDSRIVEDPFSDLDIRAESYTLSLNFRQPLVLTPTSEFSLSLALDLRQSETFLLDDIPYSFSEGPENGKSKITALRFSQDWTNRSTTQVLAARSQFSFGLDALGATVNDSGTDAQFISWLGQFQWVKALGGDVILVARTGAQLSFDSLLPIEQFSIGGVDTVRGYRQNQRVADNGVVGSVEVRFPIIRDSNGIGTIQLAPFFDIGTAWNNKGQILSPSTLASIGLGLRWQLNPSFSATLDWGIPLISVSDEGNTLQDNGITFSLRFQPF
ncbi:ShlB/FhaC/HecB family hemolysin secretion/activation protein [Microcoleus sp. FACHB-SPT15]|uniref:ShlB/FhaC/HecB family hemolysin secretion/activation protein n=1 Tax=Microcoleus sp. FACHB-SPT15 TaxID=2692830 RepID=UPI0017822F76|nr:ShlB/FhaC/HecB family hemolysin secretion/activation protein [Microcoleus sp. FACHB-SPT15]MBD1805472.1 ShlB/FhaC/HecB family hemolysin secretion/activation protein [Microcoleus sp. FACHB-SPT15]